VSVLITVSVADEALPRRWSLAVTVAWRRGIAKRQRPRI
jgi:hypothetical protein